MERPYPIDLSVPGDIQFEPLGGPNCRIFFRRQRYGTPIARQGKLIPAPFRHDMQTYRFIVRSDPIQLDINSSGKLNIKALEISVKKYSVTTWIELFSILEMTGSNEFCVEIFTEENQKIYGGKVVNAMLTEAEACQYRNILLMLRGVEQLMIRIGRRDVQFSIEEILSSGDALRKCLDLVNISGTRFSMRLDGLPSSSGISFKGKKIGILVDTLQVGPVGVMFGAIAEITIMESLQDLLLQGEIVRQGIVEPSNSMPIETFAESFGKDVGAAFQIIGDGSGSLLKGRERP
ncbi:hypothetical protein [Methylobrevis albus]|uniref:Uncharacterized protein n=1 Tax=Methylobrevis albus TaxID=2793297 RepID=A0A931HZQ6_9HYPH|nr:hypothetical protein [Methylobrevis albus]MBH0236338.1 hypothetical protein [Methylobrevis albus]